jgi:uncharacterized protein YciI
MHFALFYDYVDDFMEKRKVLRNGHLKHAWDSHARGEFQLGGVLDEPADGAMLIFKVDSRKIVEDFVAADPYVTQGLVKSWRIRPWLTAAGTGASNPAYPD